MLSPREQYYIDHKSKIKQNLQLAILQIIQAGSYDPSRIFFKKIKEVKEDKRRWQNMEEHGIIEEDERRRNKANEGEKR